MADLEYIATSYVRSIARDPCVCYHADVCQ